MYNAPCRVIGYCFQHYIWYRGSVVIFTARAARLACPSREAKAASVPAICTP